MFARILKSSLIPLLTPLRTSTLPKTLPKAYKTSLFQIYPRYAFSSATPDYNKQAQTIMKTFLQKDNISGNDILQTLNQLESVTLGITSSDANYKTFMIRLNDAIRGKLTAEQLEAIALKAHSLNIKEPLFWFSLDNTVKSSDANVGLNTLLVIFSTFLRVKSYPQFSRYLSVMQPELLEGLKNNLAELDFRSLIHASYIFASLDTPFPELTKRFKSELRSSLKNPNSADISINELATTAALLPVLLKDNDADKQGLINDLGKFLGSQDLSQYCKAHEGEESLNWQSIAFLFRTYSLPKYQNQELVSKLNDAVFQKAETSYIDFDSASILLSVLSNQDKGNSKVIEKVLDMVHTQLANEGAAMFNEFDGRNVYGFLRAVITLGQKGVNKELVGEFLEYFQGLIISNKISTKIEEEEYGLLKKLFEDAKAIGNVDARLFDHIQRRLEYIALQRKREIAENQNQM